MALILNIETSSPVCSVCLANDGQVLDYRQDNKSNSHAAVLTVLINEMLTASRLSIHQINAVAVSAGPGSYTGLRIGTSVAKGLCYAAGKPLIAVPTLQSLAVGMMQKTNGLSLYLPLIDARRMDVYTALYNASGAAILPAMAATVNDDFVKKFETYPIVYTGGNALNKCKDLLNFKPFVFVEDIGCDARLMTGIAEEKYNATTFEDVAYFEPFYLKEFGQV